MNDVRPIDWWMLFIELGILLLMLAAIIWSIPGWLEEGRRKKALKQRLDGLPNHAAEPLRRMVLNGTQPAGEAATILSRFPTPIIERDGVMGWRVLPEHRKFVENWAQKTQTAEQPWVINGP